MVTKVAHTSTLPMSAVIKASVEHGAEGTTKHQPEVPRKSNSNYKGFVAGVFSGIAKLSGLYIQFPSEIVSRLTMT